MFDDFFYDDDDFDDPVDTPAVPDGPARKMLRIHAAILDSLNELPAEFAKEVAVEFTQVLENQPSVMSAAFNSENLRVAKRSARSDQDCAGRQPPAERRAKVVNVFLGFV